MAIICFEGASAAGKTTTANRFKTALGAAVVPEVNLLFDRPKNAAPEWYLDRQFERWQIALRENELHPLVILDGDPFQPFWYCWAYDFDGWESLGFFRRYYEREIMNDSLAYPDRYFIFRVDEGELRKRKENDVTRKRRGFEKHLRMVEPQRRYFQEMQRLAPDRVRVLDAETIETTVNFVRADISDLARGDNSEDGVIFRRMMAWLLDNKA